MRKSLLLLLCVLWCGVNVLVAQASDPPQLIAPSPDNEAVIVRLPDDQLRIFYVYRPDGNEIRSISSSDNGKTWGAAKTEFPLPGVAYHAVQATVDTTGEIQLAFHIAGTGDKGYRGKHYDVYHTRTRNQRTEWEPTKRIYEGYVGSMRGFACLKSGRLILPVGVAVPSRMTAPKDAVDFGWNDVRIFYSDDQGAIWKTSDSDLSIAQNAERGKTRYGAVEPAVLQLTDGTLWMLIRSKNGQLYESRSSDDGTTWTEPAPTNFTSSDSPAAFVRIDESKLALIFNQSQRWDDPKSYAIGGRQILHAAFSDDDGKTWQGAREVLRDLSDGATKGDHGTAYPSAVIAADGAIVLISGQGDGRRSILRVDPAWLAESNASDDFSDGLVQWTHIESSGVSTSTYLDRVELPCLAIRPLDAASPASASWNFPALRSGSLSMRVLHEAGAGEVRMSITDHFSVSGDRAADDHAVFVVPIHADHSFLDTRLIANVWHDIRFRWSETSDKIEVTLDGKAAGTLQARRKPAIGANYLRVTAFSSDAARLRAASKINATANVNAASNAGLLISRVNTAGATAGASSRGNDTKAVKIAFFGDSITKGARPARGMFGPVSVDEAFTGRLGAKLQATGVNASIINAGVSGDRTDRALARLDELLQSRPDIIFVMFGTNDACYDLGNSEPRVSQSEFRANLMQLTRRLKDAGVQAILMTEPPLGSAWSADRHPIYQEKGSNFALAAYMNEVREVAALERLPLIDHYSQWLAVGGAEIDRRLLDGCHPNATGHAAMSDSILPVLIKQIEQTKLSASVDSTTRGTTQMGISNAGNLPLIIAHRGSSAVAPENTVSAYKLALAEKTDGLEGDFHLTADGEIVCVHDATMKRTGGRDAAIQNLTLSQIKTLDVGSWKDAKYVGERVPTLLEVLKLLPKDKIFYLEIKVGVEILPKFKSVIAESGVAPSQLRVISFNADVIAAVREQMPDIKAFWLTSFKSDEMNGVKHPTIDEVVATLKRSCATGLGCQADMTVVNESFVKAVRDAHCEMHVWTVDDPTVARTLWSLGVDSITTNRPGFLRDELSHP